MVGKYDSLVLCVQSLKLQFQGLHRSATADHNNQDHNNQNTWKKKKVCALHAVAIKTAPTYVRTYGRTYVAIA